MGVGHRLIIENRGETSVLICAQCDRSFAIIEEGKIKITERHGSRKDRNELTLQDLRILAGVMWQQLHPPEVW